MTLRAIGRSDPAVSHEQRRAIAQRFIELDDKLRDIDEHCRVLVTRNFWRCLPKSAAVPEVAQAQLDLHGSAGTDRVWNTCNVRQKSLRGANVAS